MSDPRKREPASRVVHRRTGRVIPVDATGRVLMLHGFEPARPDWWFWFTIGGAVEAGETVRQAAARELGEEVGIIVTEAELGEPFCTDEIEFDWSDQHIVQHQTFFAVSLPDAPMPDLGGLDGSESDTIDGARWLPVSDFENGLAEPVAPELVGYLRSAVASLPSG